MGACSSTDRARFERRHRDAATGHWFVASVIEIFVTRWPHA